MNRIITQAFAEKFVNARSNPQKNIFFVAEI